MTPEQIEALGQKLGDKIDSSVKGVQESVSDCTKAIDALKEEQAKHAAEIKVLKSGKSISISGLDAEIENGKEFSWSKAFQGIATGNWKGAEFEKELFDQTQEKALSYGTATAGGYIVPEEYSNQMIEQIYAKTVLDKMGITTLSGLGMGAPVKIPRQAGGATAYWLGENTAITESEQTLEEITLEPNMVAAFTPTSRRLVSLSNPSVENMIRNDLTKQLALAVDIKGLEGDGTGNTPTGVLNQTGILTYSSATNGDAVDYALFSELEGLLEDNNTLEGNLGFVSIPKVFRKLKNVRIPNYSGQTDGGYVIDPLVTDAVLEQRLGYMFGKTTQIDSTGTKGSGTNLTSLYFANWSELIRASWGGIVLEATTVGGDSFKKHQLFIKAVMEVDYAVRHPKSFAVATDVITA